MKLKVKKLHPKAELRMPANEGDAGYDLMAVDYEIDYGKMQVKFSTGISIEMPEPPTMCYVVNGKINFINCFEYVCKAYSRSSVKNFPFILSNCTGIVDNNYRGEIKAFFKIIDNRLDEISLLSIIEKFMQDPILQLTFELVNNNLQIEYVDELTPTKRGSNGYGSTNKKTKI